MGIYIAVTEANHQIAFRPINLSDGDKKARRLANRSDIIRFPSINNYIIRFPSINNYIILFSSIAQTGHQIKKDHCFITSPLMPE